MNILESLTNRKDDIEIRGLLNRRNMKLFVGHFGNIREGFVSEQMLWLGKYS